jgi:hypothetical protein
MSELHFLERLFLSIRGIHPDYRVGAPGWWRFKAFDHFFETRTPARFEIGYKVGVTVERFDDRRFQAAGMLQPGAIDRLIESWHTSVFLTAARTSFFAYGCYVTNSTPYMPGTFAYRIQETGGAQSIEMDANCVRLVRAANEIEWQENGCRIVVNSIQLITTPEMIERNHAMLSADTIAAIDLDHRYIPMDEAAAVLAMQRQLVLDREAAKCANKPFDDARITADRQRILELEREVARLKNELRRTPKGSRDHLLNTITERYELQMALLQRKTAIIASIDRCPKEPD